VNLFWSVFAHPAVARPPTTQERPAFSIPICTNMEVSYNEGTTVVPPLSWIRSTHVQIICGISQRWHPCSWATLLHAGGLGWNIKTEQFSTMIVIGDHHPTMVENKTCLKPPTSIILLILTTLFRLAYIKSPFLMTETTNDALLMNVACSRSMISICFLAAFS
jgi:hypothetical protein